MLPYSPKHFFLLFGGRDRAERGLHFVLVFYVKRAAKRNRLRRPAGGARGRVSSPEV